MSLNPKYRYIVVEGPIGSGKTTLARKLADHLGATTLFEDPDANPFLPGFYQDPVRHALPVQLFFLFQRSNQVRDLVQSDLFRGTTVADFMLKKDPLFAQMNLNDAELAL
jgi:thymidylate kinase